MQDKDNRKNGRNEKRRRRKGFEAGSFAIGIA